MSGIEIWNDLKEKIVPSKTTRAYIAELGWQPTDFELAALLHNQKYASMAEEFEALRSLETQDEALAAQIEGYINDKEQALREVMEEEGPYIYKLWVEQSQGPNSIGYYQCAQQALAAAQKYKRPCTIVKYILFQEAVYPIEYGDRGCVSYAWDGAVIDARGRLRPRYDKGHFTEITVEIPTPFKAGDIVYIEPEHP